MFISIIIPTYNRVEKLKRCLSHITNQSVDRSIYEIIIVDDCSKDSTPEFCNKYIEKNSNVIYIRNEQNQGLATTRNIGIRASKGTHLVFLDNDLLTDYNFLQYHIDFHKKFANEKVAIVSDITYPPEILKTTNFGTYIQSRAIGYRSEKDMKGLDVENLKNGFLAGGGSSVKSEDAFAIGLFEEGLKKYGSEDELFGHRFINSGGRVIFCPHAKIIHDDGNILPKYWRTKYIELGRYSLRTLKDKEPSLVENSLYDYLMNVNKDDDFITKIKKKIIAIGSLSVFRVPIETFVFKTDHISFFYIPFLFRYLTVAWMKTGFQTEEEIEQVTY